MTATALDALLLDWLDHLVEHAPTTAAALGDARGLGRLDPVLGEGAAAYRRESVALTRFERRVEALEPRGAEVRALVRVMRSLVAARRLQPRLRFVHRRPDLPLEMLADAVHQVLGWPGLAAGRRVELTAGLLAEVPELCRASRERMAGEGASRVLFELAVDAAGDVATLIERDVQAALGSLPGSEAAVRGLRRHARLLGGFPARDAGFRAGGEALAAWLGEVELHDETPAALLRAARAELPAARQAIDRAAKRLGPGPARATIARLEADHPSREGLLGAARSCVAELRRFTEERRLCTLPDGDSCRVEPAPDYVSALTPACIDMPGPLQKRRSHTRYLLAIPHNGEPVMGRTRLSWVSAHETYPGHHVQHLHLGRAPHPLLQIADSEVFIEGWAHYAESLLVEAAFHDGDPALALGVACARALRHVRLCAALAMHAGRTTLPAAARLFERYALLDPAEARREALRAASDPLVLAYALGCRLIEQRRRRAQATAGSRFSLLAFHDDLLCRGTAPLGLEV